MMRAAVAALVGVLVAAGAAFGEEGAPADEPEKKADAEDKAEKKKQKKDDKKTFAGDIDVGGRIFYRVDGDNVGDELRLDHEIASARVEVTWRWQWLRVVVEAELDGRLRDAYARGKWGAWEVQVGNFKPPTSVFELESAFRLPMTSRGLVNEVLVDSMHIGGRRPGAQLEWNGPGALKPKVQLGVFQPSNPINDDPVEHAEPGDTNVAGRASVDVGPLEVALFGESYTIVDDADAERHWMLGADAELERVFGCHALRAWADVQTGTHTFPIQATDGETGFLAARLAAAWRRGGIEETELYVEPYVFAGFMDPDDRFVDDLMTEAAIGVNVGAWRRVRVALELYVTRVDAPPDDLEPSPDLLEPRNNVLVDREMIRLFVGASF